MACGGHTLLLWILAQEDERIFWANKHYLADTTGTNPFGPMNKQKGNQRAGTTCTECNWDKFGYHITNHTSFINSRWDFIHLYTRSAIVLCNQIIYAKKRWRTAKRRNVLREWRHGVAADFMLPGPGKNLPTFSQVVIGLSDAPRTVNHRLSFLFQREYIGKRPTLFCYRIQVTGSPDGLG